MTIGIMSRNQFWRRRNNDKKGWILFDAGSTYINPIRLTSKKGLPGLLAWIRRNKQSIGIKLHNENYFLWPDGKLKVEVEGNKVQDQDEVSIKQYLEELDSGDHEFIIFSYYHNVYTS